MRTVALDGPVDLGRILGPVRRGRGDPCLQVDGATFRRATRTPAGPCALHGVHRGDRVELEAWGPGRQWALDHAPGLLGMADDDRGFDPGPGLVGELHRRLPGLRLTRTAAVLEALLPSVLEQKVTGREARRSWVALVRAFGEPAPGPGGLLLPPPPERLAALPYHAFHRFGIERRRADTLRRVCSRAARVEEAASMAPADARRRLTAFVGVGAWTAAEVTRNSHGDPDAVSVGDYHTPHVVCWALAGEPRGTDERMLELLAPWPGHRARVVRFLEAAGLGAPRFGPRRPLRSIARI